MPTPAIQIKGLKKRYDTGTQALNGIDLCVQAGDFFALLGPNGAGKSTTIGILTSLVNKTAGKVHIFGYDIDTHFGEAKACIGVVPQEFNFSIFEYPLQIVMNQAGYYGIPTALAAERAEYYLRKLDLWEKRFTTARQLSGGMKRRLMIARGMMHQPQLLILDEPTAGVDIEIRRDMWDFLKEINAAGTTVILTTHYLEEAENLCKNIAIIDHGDIIENTSMQTLLQKLNKETFLLDVKEPLAFAPEINGYYCQRIDEHCISVEVGKQQSLNAVFAALEAKEITVLSMRNKANRLEELFLGLVGNNSNDITTEDEIASDTQVAQEGVST